MMDLIEKKDVLNRFKDWMSFGLGNGRESEEDEVRMAGALCIGNLARSGNNSLS